MILKIKESKYLIIAIVISVIVLGLLLFNISKTSKEISEKDFNNEELVKQLIIERTMKSLTAPEGSDNNFSEEKKNLSAPASSASLEEVDPSIIESLTAPSN